MARGKVTLDALKRDLDASRTELQKFIGTVTNLDAANLAAIKKLTDRIAQLEAEINSRTKPTWPTTQQIAGIAPTLTHAHLQQVWNNIYATSMQVTPPWHEREPPTRKSTKGIVGFRAWAITADYKLRSTAADFIWEGPVLRDEHPPTFVEQQNRHGIHAYKTVEGAFNHSSGFSSNEHRRIVGQVLLHGRVIVHEYGYRAERAMILKLFIPFLYATVAGSELEEAITKLEARYQCTVTTDYRELRKLEEG